MWLTSSTIGRKFVMALTGFCLVLFVTFHVLMNAVAIAWPAAYNQICMFLGANWYALVASIGLAVLFILHIIYAVWLTILNRKARGADRYEVTSRPPQVEWSSKNMLVLGIVVLAFLVVHLIQFWAKMQWMDIVHDHAYVDGVMAPAEFGTLFLQEAFSLVWTPIVYIIGFVALWFHMTHGFWSMFHSVGWDNGIWIKRLKCIGMWWTTIVVALFIAQAIVFTVKAHQNDYLTDPKLQEQYAEYWDGAAEKVNAEFIQGYLDAGLGQQPRDQFEMMRLQQAAQMFMVENAEKFAAKYEPMMKAMDVQCPDSNLPNIVQARNIYEDIQHAISQLQLSSPSAANDAIQDAAAADELVTEETIEVEQ